MPRNFAQRSEESKPPVVEQQSKDSVFQGEEEQKENLPPAVFTQQTSTMEEGMKWNLNFKFYNLHKFQLNALWEKCEKAFTIAVLELFLNLHICVSSEMKSCNFLEWLVALPVDQFIMCFW